MAMLKMNYSRYWGTYNGIGVGDDGRTYWGNYSAETAACYLASDRGIVASRDDDGNGCGWGWDEVSWFLRHLSPVPESVTGITHG